jgi:hypothetical protein
MKWLAVLILPTLLAVACAARQPPAKRPPGLQWNWKESQEAKNTVATSVGIGPADRTMLLKALAARFKGDPDPKKRAEETRVKLIDLNDDDVAEVIAQPVDDVNCSPAGNCPFWVFQRTTDGYRLLLKKAVIQTFTVQPTRTSGYRDLVLGMHGSATEQTLFEYRFRDGLYRQTGCYDANWEYLGKDGVYHDLKEPRKTPCQR